MSDTEHLRGIVAPLVEELGLLLYDVELKGTVVAVAVDGTDGVKVDQLGLLSRAVSAALDETDPVAGAYTLEISSPGVERKLRRPDHFLGAVGEKVTVRTVATDEGRQRLNGMLVAATDTEITVQDESSGSQTLTYDRIEKARTVFEWGPAPKPKGGRRP
jgi:ribosome maturation factor RimP